DVLSKGGEKQNLQAQGSWYANQVDKTEATSLGHLARAESGYFLELLGKNGEPLIDRQVVITFHHKRFNHEIPLPLRTDARGRIALGELNQIDKIGANLPDGRAQYWW